MPALLQIDRTLPRELYDGRLAPSTRLMPQERNGGSMLAEK